MCKQWEEDSRDTWSSKQDYHDNTMVMWWTESHRSSVAAGYPLQPGYEFTAVGVMLRMAGAGAGAGEMVDFICYVVVTFG